MVYICPVTIAQASRLQRLLRRVERATQARGKKSELAHYLGVARQQLNSWLSGIKTPGGEVTLQLLEWVAAEEGKQTKSPGSVQPPPERVTRRKKPLSHENSRRSRKKA